MALSVQLSTSMLIAWMRDGRKRGVHVFQQKNEADERGVEEMNEQHPHRGDWLREIVFGRER